MAVSWALRPGPLGGKMGLSQGGIRTSYSVGMCWGHLPQGPAGGLFHSHMLSPLQSSALREERWL